MIQKKRNKKSLAELSTRFVDLGANSPDFFNISFMPEQFTAGKNLFKFKPVTSRFSTSDPIQIEIIDFNGNQIYHEVLNYKEDDGSLVVAIYVYEDTSPGDCVITFIGTTIVDENFKLLPQNERKSNNLKYQHRLYVNPLKRNDSEIIYTNDPAITINERLFSIVEEKFTTGKIVTFAGTGSYSYTTNTPSLLSIDPPFSKYFENGTIRFKQLSPTHTPSLGFTTGSFEYVSDITKVRTPFQMELKTPVTINGTLDQTSILRTITNQPYEVTYSYSPTKRIVSQNIKSYAQIDISNLQPSVGDVSRVKVFYKNTFKPESEYEQIYDGEITTKNILVDVSASTVEHPFGIFNGQDSFFDPMFPLIPRILDSVLYWSGSVVNQVATVTLSSDDTPLFGSLIATPNAELSGSAEILISQTGSIETQFYKDSEYHLYFDYYLDTQISESRSHNIDVYITGSSFVNDSVYGKFVGSIPTGSQAKKYDLDYSLKLPVNTDGTGRLVFVLRRGSVISNVRILEDVEYGFTPNRTRLYVPIKTDHRNEYLDFKIQFFNHTLKESNKSVEVYDEYFRGGNAYIYGSDNLITGSTFISPFTSSGIHTYANIQANTTGSMIKSYGFEGINKATASLNPVTASKFGWAHTVGDPFHNGEDTGTSIQMINECGSLLEFRSSPPSFNLYAIGKDSRVMFGASGSSGEIGGGGGAGDCANGTCGDSYIKWDGCRIIIKGAVDENGAPFGTGTPGTPGSSGSSGGNGTSGADGTSGTSGGNGTSGADGTSGSSGSSGSSGTSGSSGSTGTSGSSGSTGTSGTSGSSGSTGTSGTSGSSGSSGTNGTSGSSGSSGTSGTSGSSGSSGTSGTSGSSGSSGTNGTSGSSGLTPDPLSCCDCFDLYFSMLVATGNAQEYQRDVLRNQLCGTPPPP